MAHDNDADLIRMVNQIAAFFEPYPAGEALEGVVTHIRKFWEPRMRDGLDGIMERGGEGLSPLALDAGKILHQDRQGAGA